MSESGATALSRRATAALLFAVFTATVGYGVVLPVLPHVVESLSPAASTDRVGWHTGFLTSVFAGGAASFRAALGPVIRSWRPTSDSSDRPHRLRLDVSRDLTRP